MRYLQKKSVFFSIALVLKKNDPLALHRLGRAYFFGYYGLQEDLQKAEEYWLKGYEAGDAASAYDLCYLFVNNFVYLTESVFWLELAVKGGFDAALVEIAEVYLCGIGVNKDLEKVEYYLRKALALTDANYIAYSMLGTLLLEKNNREEGLTYLKQAAMQDEDKNAARIATFRLAIEEPEQKEYWLCSAVAHGNTNAAMTWGLQLAALSSLDDTQRKAIDTILAFTAPKDHNLLLLLQGYLMVKQEKDPSIHWQRAEAEGPSAVAAWLLRYKAFRESTSNSVELETTTRLLLLERVTQKAALLTTEDVILKAYRQDGQHLLLPARVEAICHFLGWHKNPDMESVLLLMAWGREDPQVALALATIHLQQKSSLSLSDSQQLELWQVAGEAGHLDAILQLGFAYNQKLYGLQHDVEAEERWWRRGAELGNVACMCNLGYLLANKNKLAEAILLWHKAAEQGGLHGDSPYWQYIDSSHHLLWLDMTGKGYCN